MRRRDFFILFGSIATAWPRMVLARKGYLRFTPLPDRPERLGEPPADGQRKRKDDYGDARLRTRRGRFHASFTSGADSPAASGGNVYITIKPSYKHTSTIDGFEVTTVSTPSFVMISIALGPNAMLNLLFNNVSEDEATEIAQKFDWKGIQAELG